MTTPATVTLDKETAEEIIEILYTYRTEYLRRQRHDAQDYPEGVKNYAARMDNCYDIEVELNDQLKEES